jgi:hypothetical protein
MVKKKDLKIKDSGYFAKKRDDEGDRFVSKTFETKEEIKKRRAEKEEERKRLAEQRIEAMLEEERKKKKELEEQRKALWEKTKGEEKPRIRVKSGKTEFKPETLVRKKAKTISDASDAKPKIIIKKQGRPREEKAFDPKADINAEVKPYIKEAKTVIKTEDDIIKIDEKPVEPAPRPMLKQKEEKVPYYDEATLAKEVMMKDVKVKSLGGKPTRKIIKRGKTSETDVPKFDKDTKKERVYRHELKYYITQADFHLLRNSLSCLLKHDSNAGENGDYYIRSLYFDDYKNTALVDKLSGIENRKKYRIRIYGLSDDFIRLERKNKTKEFISKDSLVLSREEFDMIIEKKFGFLLKKENQLAKDFYYEIKTKKLEPTVIVDYVREAYVHPIKNLRVTFDKVVKTGRYDTSIFNQNVALAPVLPPGTVVLEIKFEKGMPDYLIGVLNTIKASQRSAISKYALSRKYE